jgi:small subunit ribosomal protein S15
MAKMHSKKRGKSRRKRQKLRELPAWADANVDEIKEAVRKLSKQGMKPSDIGLVLRDSYAVPSFKLLTGKTLMQFLREEKLYTRLPEDFLQLITKATRLWAHLKNNRKDALNKVKYGHVVAKINRLTKYYTRRKVLEKGWKYTPESAALLVR